jgi:hypothetical protein
VLLRCSVQRAIEVPLDMHDTLAEVWYTRRAR